MKFCEAVPPAVLTLVFLVSVAAVGRLPSVPIDDSWSYYMVLQHFLRTGRPVYDSFTSAASIIHLLIAGAAAAVFGLSVRVAVGVNLVVTWLSLLAVYALGRQAGAGRAVSTLAALAFLAAPPVFVAAFTFWCDPVFTLLLTLSMIGFVRYARRGDPAGLIAGSLLAALSVWGKIHGLLIVPAVAAFLVRDKRFRGKVPAQDWVWLLAPTAVSYLLFRLAKPIIHPVTGTLDRKWGEFFGRLASPEVWVAEGTRRVGLALIVVGFFLLPLAAAVVLGQRKPEDKPAGRRALRWLPPFLAFAVVAPVVIYLWRTGAPWAIVSSVLNKQPAMEPMPIHGKLYLGALIALPLWIFLLTREAAAGFFKEKDASLFLLGAAVFAFQLLLLVPIKWYMDRYFVALLPPAILMTVSLARTTRVRVLVFVPVVLAFFAVDVARVRQYRDGLDTQWRAADALVVRGIDSLLIDGGYPWLGLTNFEKCQGFPGGDFRRVDLMTGPDSGASAQNTTQPPVEYRTHYVFELCPYMKPRWFVTFFPPGQGDGRVIDRTYSYDAGPGLGERKVFVLKIGEM